MLQKPDGCKDCPLKDKGKGFVPDIIQPNAEYVFIGEAPGKHEITEGKPFVGQAGYVLKEWLLKAVSPLRLKYEQNRISIGNTLRCLPPEIQGRAYPRGAERISAERCCRQYDNLGSAHTIILFGESAQRCWFGPELEAEDLTDRRLGHDIKGVMGRIGRVYVKEGRRYVFAPHPAWILRQPSLVEHGQQALKIAAEVDKTLDITYTNWDSCLRELA